MLPTHNMNPHLTKQLEEEVFPWLPFHLCEAITYLCNAQNPKDLEPALQSLQAQITLITHPLYQGCAHAYVANHAPLRRGSFRFAFQHQITQGLLECLTFYSPEENGETLIPYLSKIISCVQDAHENFPQTTN